jgi:hypothetical protein
LKRIIHIPAIRIILERPDGTLLGTMVPVGDSATLARTLVATLRSPRDDEALAAGRRAFADHFTTEAVAEQMVALYRSTLGRRLERHRSCSRRLRRQYHPGTDGRRPEHTATSGGRNNPTRGGP